MIAPFPELKKNIPTLAGGIASWTEKLLRNQLPNGYELHYVNTRYRGKRLQHANHRLSFSEVWRTLYILGSLIHKLTIVRPQIVHLNSSLSPAGVFRGWLCLLFARVWGIPVVTHYRGDLTDFPEDRYGGIAFWALSRLIRRSHQNLVLNQQSYEYVSDINPLSILPLEKLPNFIDEHIFHQCASPGLGDSTKQRVIFVGYITEAKGGLEILEAARQFPDWEFVLIGNVAQDMQSAIKSRSENVVLKGSLSYEAVLNELCDSHVFLFPSHSEGFPNSVLEAMSVGLPVVATRVGSIPEMIEQGLGGYLIECGDVRSLIQALQSLADDPEQRLRMGYYNRTKSRRCYTYSIVISRLIEIYERVQIYHRISRDFG